MMHPFFAKRNSTNNNNNNNNIRFPTLPALAQPLNNIDWSAPMPWDSQVDDLKIKQFGINNPLLPVQRQTINATLAAQDVFCILPTGAGKSLCFQLPAMFNNNAGDACVTIVFSPLISLIQDQLTWLHHRNIPVAAYNNTLTGGKGITRALRDEWQSSNTVKRIVFITPEMFNSSSDVLPLLLNLHTTQRIARFVVDEAHVVAEWGLGFRSDYKDVLSNLKRRFNGVPILALTATATPDTMNKVKEILNISNTCVTFKGGFNRPNLSYAAWSENTKTEREKKKKKDAAETAALDSGKQTPFDRMVNLIKNNYLNKSGIVYCLTKEECDSLSNLFGIRKIKALPYHAGLSQECRDRFQRLWMQTNSQQESPNPDQRVHVLCATTAFGMGINKPNVSFVFHKGMPASIEGYYQESGRAGRDNTPASCVMFCSRGDRKTHLFNMIPANHLNAFPEIQNKFFTPIRTETVVHQLEKLFKMERYALYDQVTCRRKQTLEYFGEDFTSCLHQNEANPNNSNLCDHCLSLSTGKWEAREINYSNSALQLFALLSYITHVTQTFATPSFLCQVYRDTGLSQNTKEFKRRHSAKFGQGKALHESVVRAIIIEMTLLKMFTAELVRYRNPNGHFAATILLKPNDAEFNPFDEEDAKLFQQVKLNVRDYAAPANRKKHQAKQQRAQERLQKKQQQQEKTNKEKNNNNKNNEDGVPNNKQKSRNKELFGDGFTSSSDSSSDTSEQQDEDEELLLLLDNSKEVVVEEEEDSQEQQIVEDDQAPSRGRNASRGRQQHVRKNDVEIIDVDDITEEDACQTTNQQQDIIVLSDDDEDDDEIDPVEKERNDDDYDIWEVNLSQSSNNNNNQMMMRDVYKNSQSQIFDEWEDEICHESNASVRRFRKHPKYHEPLQLTDDNNPQQQLSQPHLQLQLDQALNVYLSNNPLSSFSRFTNDSAFELAHFMLDYANFGSVEAFYDVVENDVTVVDFLSSVLPLVRFLRKWRSENVGDVSAEMVQDDKDFIASLKSTNSDQVLDDEDTAVSDTDSDVVVVRETKSSRRKKEGTRRDRE
jgi:RecQ family ATP-dependent DNA helicase